MGERSCRERGRAAQDLGYFDEAHLSRELKAMVGRSPSAYRRAAARGAARGAAIDG
jgi:AraC-like DNA-binding protein